MANCVNCGAILDPYNEYCIYCGTHKSQQHEAVEVTEADAVEANTEQTSVSETGNTSAANKTETTAEAVYESVADQEESEWADKAKTVGKVLGTVVSAALGASLLGHSRRNRPMARKSAPARPVHTIPAHRPAEPRKGTMGIPGHAAGMTRNHTMGMHHGDNMQSQGSRGMNRNAMHGPVGGGHRPMGCPGGRR